MQKPEYVLQRADELIKMAIGNGEKEKRLALDHLHGHIQATRNKRQTQWNKVYESLMKRHLELAELRDDRTAKDGLHQYRFMSQQMDPNSLENVIFYLIEMAEAKALTAREKADTVALAAAAKVQDLDQEESPESIMLSSMTDEGSRGRTDIEVVVPWLKFLWEIYRIVLELLYKNSKLERVYHSAATKALVLPGLPEKSRIQTLMRYAKRPSCESTETNEQDGQGAYVGVDRKQWSTICRHVSSN